MKATKGLQPFFHFSISMAGSSFSVTNHTWIKSSISDDYNIGDSMDTVETFHATVFCGVPKMYKFCEEHEKTNRFCLISQAEAFDNIKLKCDLSHQN